MSTSVSTRSPGTLNPTRQQLDELDALLKRMLELPVNQLDAGDDTEDEVEDEAEDVADEPVSPPAVIPPYNGRELRKGPLETKPAAPPVSYMVVETASARPLPAASGFEPRPSVLMPRPAPVTPTVEDSFEEEPPAPAAPPEQMPAVDSPAPEAEAEAEVWVPLRSTWQPSAQTWQPLADSWQQANGTTPAPAPMFEPMPSPQLAVTPPTPDPIDLDAVHRLAAMVGHVPRLPQDLPGETPIPLAPPRTSETPVPPARETPVPPARLSLSAEDAPLAAPPLLLPLVWFNQGFDACLAPLGEPGRWLSGPKGRQTLGMVGLLCLAAATVVAVSAGMGWSW